MWSYQDVGDDVKPLANCPVGLHIHSSSSPLPRPLCDIKLFFGKIQLNSLMCLEDLSQRETNCVLAAGFVAQDLLWPQTEMPAEVCKVSTKCAAC